MGDSKLYQFGSFQLSSAQHVVLRNGEQVPLRPKVFDTLLLLLQNRGYVLSKEYLLKRLWPDTFVDENNLYGNICTLRKVLGRDHEYIETVPKVGFRFIADVIETDEESLSPSVDGRFVDFGNSGQSFDSIAVLPFVDVGSDPATEYLSDGITESLIQSLSQIAHLKVTSRASVFRYGSGSVDPHAVGRDLRVSAVLTGRVISTGGGVCISTELVDVREGTRIWGERYEGKLEDILEVQEKISKATVRRLRPKLAGEDASRLAKGYPREAEAYQSYLKGLYLSSKRTPQSVKKAIACFEHAITIDPGYALARAEMALCYVWLSFSSGCPPKEWIATAVTLAKAAAALDDESGEAHAAVAYANFANWDWSNVASEFERALELSPNSSEIREKYSVYLATEGDFEEAMRQIEIAEVLDPLSLSLKVSAGKHMYMAGLFDIAIKRLTEALDIERDFPMAHWCLADAYAQKGRFREALSEYGTTARMLGLNLERELDPRDFMNEPDAAALLAKMGYVHARSGNTLKARRALARLTVASENGVASPIAAAQICIALGNWDRAFAWLETAFLAHANALVWLDVDPIYAPLRYDNRFDALRSRIGLPRKPHSPKPQS